MKVSEKLDNLRRITPLGPSEFGQLYSAAADLTRSYKRISVWTIFRSDKNTHLIRPHVFESKKKARTPLEWNAWLARNLDEIQRKDVLGGLKRRTGRTYFIYKRLGWVGHAGKFANTSAVGRKWRPTKSKG